MKHVIYLLLVANVVYFSWNLLSGSNEVARSLPPIPETATRLVTLQEMQASELAEIEAETKAKPPGAGVEVSNVEAVTKAKSPGTGVEASNIEAVMKAEPPGAGIALGCQLLGPFLSIGDLQPLKERLGTSGLEPRQQTREEQNPVGYWVYLPAMEREAALEIRQTLDDASDSEYFIGKDNFISLGAFKEISRAETRIKAVRKLGLEPTLEPRFETSETHWLELDAAGEDPENRERISGILQEFPGVQSQAAACGSIAVTDAIQ